MKYILYKITIQDFVYIGSTKNFTRRKCEHKQSCNRAKDFLLYNTINALGGWNYCIITPIEEYECDSNIQAHIREEHFRKEYQANLNMVRCHATEDEIKQDAINLYELNKDEIRNVQKHYYELNKDTIKLRHQANKEQINAKRRLNYASKKNNTV